MRIQKIYFPVFLLNKEMTLFCCEYFSITKKNPLSIYKHPTQRYPFLYHSSRMLILSCYDWPLHLEQIIAVYFLF